MIVSFPANIHLILIWAKTVKLQVSILSAAAAMCSLVTLCTSDAL